MAVVGDAFFDVHARIDELDRQLKKQVGDSIQKNERHWTSIAKKVGLAIGGAFAINTAFQFGKSTIDAASDLSESMSKVNVVFGDSAKEINDWSKQSANALGVSQQKALEAAGTYGNLFRAMGITSDASKDMSIGLVNLSADLASFNNANPEDVLEALRAGLTGETEPLKKFGINMNAARLEAEALNLGLIRQGEEMDSAAKAQAAYSLIMKDTTLAQGDFARTSDGAANQSRKLAANMENLKARIGQGLLPIFEKLLGFVVNTVIPGIDAMVNAFQGDALESGGFLGFMSQVGVIARDVFEFLRANVPPIMAAVVAGFQVVADWVAENWPAIRDEIASVMESIQQIIEAVLIVINFIWENYGDLIIERVRIIFEFIRGTIENALQVIRGIIQVITGLISGDWDRVWQGIRNIVGGLLDQIRVVVETALGLIRNTIETILRSIADVFTAIFGGIVEGMRNLMGDLGTVVRGGVEEIGRQIGRIPGLLREVIGSAAAAATDIGAAILRGMVSGLGEAVGAAGDFARAFANAVIDTVNEQIIDRINDALEFKVKGPGFLPDVSVNPPDIPHIRHFQRGGVAPAGTLAIFGETGAELGIVGRTTSVFPHNEFQQQMIDALRVALGSSGARGLTIGPIIIDNVTSDNAEATAERLAQALALALRHYGPDVRAAVGGLN